MTALAAVLAGAAFVVVAGCLGYLYVLAVASIPVRHWPPRTPARHRFAIVIAARDEEGTIGATVRQLGQQSYPSELYSVIVIADNCDDRTADEARAAGAVALERIAPDQRSKGYALGWALPQMVALRPLVDAIVIFDADTRVDKDFLAVMDAMLYAGCRAIQGKHVIANPGESWFAGMMFASFAVDNRLRNAGRSNLGWSCKLMGDAMCFHRSVVEAHPWSAVSETEDAEYWATLVLAGERIVFAPQALAFGAMVTRLKDATRQRARWMRGRAAVARRFVPRLLDAAVSSRRWKYFDAAVELGMPSQPTLLLLLAAATLGTYAIGTGAIPRPLLWFVWIALCGYPVLGLWLEGAPGSVYLSLATAPLFLLWRSFVRIRVWRGGESASWIRTPRPGVSASTGFDSTVDVDVRRSPKED